MKIHRKISELERELDADIIVETAIVEPDVVKRRNARIELINLKHSLWFFQYKVKERIEEILRTRKSSAEIELDLAYQSIDFYAKELEAKEEYVKIERVKRELEELYQFTKYQLAKRKIKEILGYVPVVEKIGVD